MGTSVADRMERMRARKKAAGLRQVLVWVPDEQAEALRRYAAELVATRIDGTTVQPEPLERPQSGQGGQPALSPLVSNQTPPEPPRTASEGLCGIAFRFAQRPPAEVRDQIKRMGAAYRPDDKHWTAKFQDSEKEAVEKLLISLGAEIILSKTIQS